MSISPYDFWFTFIALVFFVSCLAPLADSPGLQWRSRWLLLLACYVVPLMVTVIWFTMRHKDTSYLRVRSRSARLLIGCAFVLFLPIGILFSLAYR